VGLSREDHLPFGAPGHTPPLVWKAEGATSVGGLWVESTDMQSLTVSIREYSLAHSRAEATAPDDLELAVVRKEWWRLALKIALVGSVCACGILSDRNEAYSVERVKVPRGGEVGRR